MLSQLGFYTARESFKRAKINASVRKHKRMVKRNIKNGRKGLKPPYDTAKENRKKDSLTYSGGFSGICKEMSLVFETLLKKDTIVAHYRFDAKDLSEDEKKIIDGLVKKTGPESFTKIIIINCHKKSVLSEYELVWTEERSRKIKKYLKSIGVPTDIVRMDD